MISNDIAKFSSIRPQWLAHFRSQKLAHFPISLLCLTPPLFSLHILGLYCRSHDLGLFLLPHHLTLFVDYPPAELLKIFPTS
jgi:hypothetical protein